MSLGTKEDIVLNRGVGNGTPLQAGLGPDSRTKPPAEAADFKAHPERLRLLNE
jgi:hypothetical protein